MFPSCLIALGIAGPCTGRKAELTSQKSEQLRGWGFIWKQRATRVAQEGELDRKAQPILNSSSATNQAKILFAQNVMLDQTRPVKRDSLKSRAL